MITGLVPSIQICTYGKKEYCPYHDWFSDYRLIYWLSNSDQLYRSPLDYIQLPTWLNCSKPDRTPRRQG